MNHATSAAGSPEPQRPIPAALDTLQSALQRLEHTAGVLADRAARVLRPEPPAAPAPSPGNGLTSVKAKSQVSEQVDMATALVERVNVGLQNLIERLEA